MPSGAQQDLTPIVRLRTPLRVRTVRLTWLQTGGDPIHASLVGYKLDDAGNRLPPPVETKPKLEGGDGGSGGGDGGDDKADSSKDGANEEAKADPSPGAPDPSPSAPEEPADPAAVAHAAQLAEWAEAKEVGLVTESEYLQGELGRRVEPLVARV